MLGPYEAMHDLRLYRTWLQIGKVQADVLKQSNPNLIASTINESFSELKRREELTDVKIADWIKEVLLTEKLFFTINHPRFILLKKVAIQLLEKVNLSVDCRLSVKQFEPLGRYVVPGINTSEQLYGDEWPSLVGIKQRRLYSPDELATTFQELYSSTQLYLNPENIRFTPNFGWEANFLKS